MKCPICGKQTLPGAKLCGPCRAALKRAKDDSVWELPPSQRPGERPAPSATESHDADWVLGAPRFAGWRMWALGAAALTVCVGIGVQFARSGESAAAQALATPPAGARAVAPEPPAAALPHALPASTQVPGESAATSSLTRDDNAQVQPPRYGEPHPAARPPKPPKPVSDVPPPAAPTIEAPVAEPVRIAAPPPAPPVRPVDPLQRMQDSLARCHAESFFDRPACESRARAGYCDGRWGEIAQCPAPNANDHGQ